MKTKKQTRIGNKELLEIMFSDECDALFCSVEATIDVATPERLRPEMTALLEFMGGLAYNNFDGEAAVSFIQKNLKSLYRIRFGREYSPVFYFHLACPMPEKKAAFEADLRKALKPDECHWEGNALRAWFD